MENNEKIRENLVGTYGADNVRKWEIEGITDRLIGRRKEELLAAHTAHGIAYSIGWNGEPVTKLRFRVEVLDLMHLHLDPIFIEAASKVDAIRKVKARMKVYRLKISEYSFKARLTNDDDKQLIGYLAEFGD